MDKSQELRRRFLQDSARRLLLTGPSTSRQLMCESLLLQPAKATNDSQNTSTLCAACGNALLPQWTTEIKFTTKKMQRDKPSRSGKIPTRKLRSQKCSMCSRVTKTAVNLVPAPTKTEDTSVQTAAPEEPTAPAPISSSVPGKSDKSSSKKRAKARKDREGLQAMLKNSAQAKPSPALSLMDLMKA